TSSTPSPEPEPAIAASTRPQPSATVAFPCYRPSSLFAAPWDRALSAVYASPSATTARRDVVPVISQLIAPVFAIERPEQVLVVRAHHLVDLPLERLTCCSVDTLLLSHVRELLCCLDLDVERLVDQLAQLVHDALETPLCLVSSCHSGKLLREPDLFDEVLSQRAPRPTLLGVLDRLDLVIELIDVCHHPPQLVVFQRGVQHLLRRRVELAVPRCRL